MNPRTINCIVFFILFFSGLSFSQAPDESGSDIIPISNTIEFNDISNYSNCNIGITDSVFIHLASAYQIATFIDIPVFIRSASTIYSLDFEMRYNEQRVLLDTLIVFNSNLQYLYYYNLQDSTLRFTSNSLTPILNDSTILILRFEVLSGPICSNDIQDVSTLLNGDLCSYYVSNCVISGTPELLLESSPLVYPNPATDYLKILPVSDGVFQLFNSAGNSITDLMNLNADAMTFLNTTLFPAGIYFYHFQSDASIYNGKVVISR